MGGGCRCGRCSCGFEGLCSRFTGLWFKLCVLQFIRLLVGLILLLMGGLTKNIYGVGLRLFIVFWYIIIGTSFVGFQGFVYSFAYILVDYFRVILILIVVVVRVGVQSILLSVGAQIKVSHLAYLALTFALMLIFVVDRWV